MVFDQWRNKNNLPDTILIENSAGKFQELVNKITRKSEEMGFKLNTKKTK